MKGRLSDQPLAELIREINSKGLHGTLRLEHERAQAAVYFEEGQVVFAASNVRSLRLREYLAKSDLVSEKQLEGLGNLSDLSLAKTLQAKGSLRAEDVTALMTTLVRDTLRVALLWTEGNWDFNERARLDDPARVRVDVNNLLREAAQRLPLQFVSTRFRNPAEIVSRATDVSGTLSPGESFMLSRLDAPTSVEQLVAVSGLRELDAYRILYGLTISGLVTREYWQNAFRTEAQAAPTRPPIAAEPGSAPVPVNARWGALTEERELQPFFDRMAQATNYYQVLDLPLTAEATEIKEAYYALARSYHPDRFHVRSGTVLHTQLSSCFARITQAYETLTDPDARSTYDRGLARSKQFGDPTPRPTATVSAEAEEIELDAGASGAGQAEYNFKEGFAALKQGRNNIAISHLAAASRLDPTQARYRAYYGRALAAGEKTRRLAENEMQAAVSLDPRNAAYRTMLAELYFDLKFLRRAQTELERALGLDPNNASAKLLLSKIERAAKTR
jgi:DnaJ-domain-containing protein 1/Tfp pilus assembly protein PilF